MTDEKKAALPGGFSHISPSDFSIASPRGKDADAPFDSIAAAIAGQQAGACFVRDLRDGMAAPDALCLRLRELAGDAARLRGFCRALQKQLERGAA